MSQRKDVAAMIMMGIITMRGNLCPQRKTVNTVTVLRQSSSAATISKLALAYIKDMYTSMEIQSITHMMEMEPVSLLFAKKMEKLLEQ